MKREEVFLAWAPKDSVWSPWVLPVPFAQMNCLDFAPALEVKADSFPWILQGDKEEFAYILDLPGEQAIRYGLTMAGLGLRPVPVIDGSPGAGEFYFSREPQASTTPAWHPNVAVDMTELLRALCEGASVLPGISIAPNALPAFLLDSRRMSGQRVLSNEIYDNRWQVFPQDFPSAKFLLEHGVRRVMLVQEHKGQPQEDLAHVLLRWQEGGIAIETVGISDGSSREEIRVTKPSWFRRIWYRALAVLKLRRSWSGGFGGFPMISAG